MGSLGHRAILASVSEEPAPQWLHRRHAPPAQHRTPVSVSLPVLSVFPILFLFSFLITTVLMGMKWYLVVTGVCVSPISDLVFYVLIGHLYISREVSTQVLCPFFPGFVLLLAFMWRWGGSLRILGTESLQNILQVFSPTLKVAFSHPGWCFFDTHEFFLLMRSNLSTFFSH